jgi:predicted RNase H-like HicB family nuclease
MAIANGPGSGFITVTFTVRYDDETRRYVGYCPELGTSSSGETVQDAFEAIEEATSLYMDTLEEVGERPRVFKERGISIASEPAQEVSVRVRRDEYATSKSLPYKHA